MKKIIILTISVLILLFSVCSVFAEPPQAIVDNVINDGGGGLAKTNNSSGGVSGLVDKSWDIVGVIAWCGYAVALGMMIYIGIKYMLGSVDAKANMKSALTSYLIGAAFVFCASTIALVVSNLAAGGEVPNDLAGQIISGANAAAGIGDTTPMDD